MRLVEGQRKSVVEPPFPGGCVFTPKDLGEVCAVPNCDELPLVPGVGSPFGGGSPYAPFDCVEVCLVAQVRAQAAVPVAADLVLEVPPLHLEDADAAVVA
eukprot:CAMPEP_0173363746 /NCGR_PEP_ID=MMETSP1144-20121109/22573_1 /TAXON_ID=483371 /ORGANISM="non described non described, Strain CCMP2298" /LENGTH=99 /DNA_ID=CAMNT_0014313763 /DNA_START=117 /DNA_END=416 /DNA_ORIENTATION=-